MAISYYSVILILHKTFWIRLIIVTILSLTIQMYKIFKISQTLIVIFVVQIAFENRFVRLLLHKIVLFVNSCPDCFCLDGFVWFERWWRI